MQDSIQLVIEFVLPYDGIVIAKDINKPVRGMSLESNSTLNGHLVKGFTAFRAAYPDGSRRRDLVGFCLVNKNDAKTFVVGEAVWLKGISTDEILSNVGYM